MSGITQYIPESVKYKTGIQQKTKVKIKYKDVQVLQIEKTIIRINIPKYKSHIIRLITWVLILSLFA